MVKFTHGDITNSLNFVCRLAHGSGDTLFKKKEIHLVTYKSGQTKTEVDYYLVGRDQRRYFKDIKVLRVEETSSNIKHWYMTLRK